MVRCSDGAMLEVGTVSTTVSTEVGVQVGTLAVCITRPAHDSPAHAPGQAAPVPVHSSATSHSPAAVAPLAAAPPAAAIDGPFALARGRLDAELPEGFGRVSDVNGCHRSERSSLAVCPSARPHRADQIEGLAAKRLVRIAGAGASKLPHPVVKTVNGLA